VLEKPLMKTAFYTNLSANDSSRDQSGYMIFLGIKSRPLLLLVQKVKQTNLDHQNAARASIERRRCCCQLTSLYQTGVSYRRITVQSSTKRDQMAICTPGRIVLETGYGKEYQTMNAIACVDCVAFSFSLSIVWLSVL